MNLYEGMFLFDANLAGRDWPGLERHVEDLMRRNSAKLEFTERWPDRKLAYEIKGCKKGTYYLTYFHASSASIAGLERDCQLSEKVLRLLVTKDDGLEEELERRRQRQAEAHAESHPEVDAPSAEAEGSGDGDVDSEGGSGASAD